MYPHIKYILNTALGAIIISSPPLDVNSSDFEFIFQTFLSSTKSPVFVSTHSCCEALTTQEGVFCQEDQLWKIPTLI